MTNKLEELKRKMDEAEAACDAAWAASAAADHADAAWAAYGAAHLADLAARAAYKTELNKNNE